MSTDSYIHRHAPGRDGAPLMFLFHGTGGDENQFADIESSLLPGASVIAPRGDVSEHGAARYFRRTAEGVYDMEDLARATAKMAGFVRAWREQTGAPASVGVGYSNGANMLASVLFAEPGLFDAVVLMHPLIPFAPRFGDGIRGRPVLMTAGRRDPICPAQMTSRLEAWLRDAGAEVELVWHEGGHELRPSELQAASGFLARRLARLHSGE